MHEQDRLSTFELYLLTKTKPYLAFDLEKKTKKFLSPDMNSSFDQENPEQETGAFRNRNILTVDYGR